MPTATPTGTATGIPVAGSAPAPALAVPLGGLLSLSASSTSKSIQHGRQAKNRQQKERKPFAYNRWGANPKVVSPTFPSNTK
jgi:hypothetical protein